MEELQIIEYSNKRVLTTQQLAEVYETSETNIKTNFNRNKERFIIGKHYHVLKGEELKAFKSLVTDSNDPSIKFASILYLWTEKGADRHCKILDTDKAWEQFDKLEDTYFKVKEMFNVPKTLPDALRAYANQVEQNEKLMLENKTMKHKADFYDSVADSKTAIPMDQVAKVLDLKGIGRNKLFEILRKIGILQYNNIPYQKYVDAGYFRVAETKYTKPNGDTYINIKTLVYQKGVNYIHKKVIENGTDVKIP